MDAQAVERIVAALGDLAGRTVVEIGPGRGAITGALAARAGRVLAIELDRELAAGLRGQFNAERVTVVEQDVLQFDFAAAAAEAGERLRVVGNLPYYITSPILLKLGGEPRRARCGRADGAARSCGARDGCAGLARLSGCSR